MDGRKRIPLGPLSPSSLKNDSKRRTLDRTSSTTVESKFTGFTLHGIRNTRSSPSPVFTRCSTRLRQLLFNYLLQEYIQGTHPLVLFMIIYVIPPLKVLFEFIIERIVLLCVLIVLSYFWRLSM